MGRPRKYPIEPPQPPRRIAIIDPRSSDPHRMHIHENVPRNWEAHDILERFGLREHLLVIEVDADGKLIDTIQKPRS